MKRSFIAALICLTLLLSGAVSDIYAQAMESYCQLPPFLSSSVESNILFAVDASGSMGYGAYSYNDSDGNDDGYLDGYNPNTPYEGYFTPSKYYKTDANGIYEETASTGQPCTCTCVTWKCSLLFGCVRHGGGCWGWGCCTKETCTGDCTIDSGNYLNYKHMTRIDLLRWAMTGGAPSACSDSTSGNAYCDPELWNRRVIAVIKKWGPYAMTASMLMAMG